MKLYRDKNKSGKMKRTIIYMLGFMIVGVLVSVGIVFAFNSRFMSEEQRLAIKRAIEENNFEAWKAAMEQTLTQENFNKLVERYKTITERKELLNKVKQAIKEGNYTAYKESMEKLVSLYIMSEEQFNAMIHHYNITKPGRFGKFIPLYGFEHRRGFDRYFIPW
jgi:uncharacterized membrane protein YgaE (UPF0421/DUF939 family)